MKNSKPIMKGNPHTYTGKHEGGTYTDTYRWNGVDDSHLTAVHLHNNAVAGTGRERVHGRQLHRIVVVFGVELSSVIIVDEFVTVAGQEILLGLPGSIRQVKAFPFDEELRDVLLNLPYTGLRSRWQRRRGCVEPTCRCMVPRTDASSPYRLLSL